MFSSTLRTRSAFRLLSRVSRIQRRTLNTRFITINDCPLLNSRFQQSYTFDRRFKFSIDVTSQINAAKFEEVCEETLESLCECFEELVESCDHLKGADVTYGDGVLTVSFGQPYGTYVINRQTPNRQIWLSSPTSGPKRYDYSDQNNGCWIYKHDGISLHQLLQKEICTIVKKTPDFSRCSYSLI